MDQKETKELHFHFSIKSFPMTDCRNWTIVDSSQFQNIKIAENQEDAKNAARTYIRDAYGINWHLLRIANHLFCRSTRLTDHKSKWNFASTKFKPIPGIPKIYYLSVIKQSPLAPKFSGYFEVPLKTSCIPEIVYFQPWQE